MKKYTLAVFIAVSFFAAGIFMAASANQKHAAGYILEHEADIAKNEAGPHDGTGTTTAYSFFSKASNSKLVFRKRILHPGASIGYHLQKVEEIYYVLSGTGEMSMNNDVFEVKSGDAILTFPGSSHGLKQKGTEDLIIIINYTKHND